MDHVQKIIEALPVAVCVTDAEGNTTHCNSTAALLSGCAPQTASDKLCTSWRMLYPDGTPVTPGQHPITVALRERRSVSGAELIVEKPDGEHLPVAAHCRPLWDDEGNLLGGVHMLLDMSKAKEAAEATARLAAIVSSSDDAIISKTLDGIVRSWNEGAERIFGYSAADVVGGPINIIIPPELQDEETAILRRLRNGERIDHFDTVRITKDGRRINISLTISPVKNEHGQIIGASKVARDITERKRTEAALKATDQRKDEFLATLAHELRNPLAPLRNTLEILELADTNPELLMQAQGTMKRQVDRLVRLVDDLMDVSRINQGKLKLSRERVGLSALIESAVEEVQDLLDEGEHSLRVELPDEPVLLDCDPLRMGQIITNLLSNAAKYTPAGGRIAFIGELDDAGIYLIVRDNGIGIAADKLETVFDMFGQLDRTQHDIEEGLGIGLTLVRSLVEAHGGTVRAKSAGPGTGSEFVISLPRAMCSRETLLVTPPRKSQAISNESRHRVLVVDDNQDAAAALAMLLEMSGHDVRTAYDGTDALDIAAEFQPEFALIDIGLPNLDGCEVAKHIRRTRWGKKAILIAVTGWGQEAHRSRTKAAGFDEHLTKPLTLERLHSVLKILNKPRAGD